MTTEPTFHSLLTGKELFLLYQSHSPLSHNHGTYTDPGENYYEQKYRERLVKHLKKTAQSLGFEVVPHSPKPESVS